MNPDSIWIVETSRDPQQVLTPLQLCGLESVAKHHSNASIYMGFVSPSISISPRVEALVEKYENIKLRYISLDDLFSLESPLHELWLSGKVQESHWSVSHTSDIVR